MTVDEALVPAERRPPRRRTTGVLLAGGAVLSGLLGYVAGARSSDASVAVHHGTAVLSPSQIGATAGGVSYAIPLDVPWKDRSGGWHQGDRPDCLPATATSAPVTFGAVAYHLHGVGGNAVVWVDCSR